MDDKSLKVAEELWNEDKAYEAGQVVCENLPVGIQPFWAARILRLVLKQAYANHTLLGRIGRRVAHD